MSILPQYGSGSISRGMWHQYGDQIRDSEGIWMSISDIPDTPLYTKNCSDESVGNGCVFVNQPENVVTLKNTNAEAIVYIRNYSLLTSKTITVDNSVIGENVLASSLVPPFALGFLAATNNYVTANSLANAINNRVYLWPGQPYFDDLYGSNPAGVPLSWRVTASVFLPESYPWIDNAGPVLTDPVAAVRIQIRDTVSAVTNYPNYYAAGVLGNSREVKIDNVPLGWMLLGNDLNSNVKRFSDHVRFRNGVTPRYVVRSLADLVGFKKDSKRLGQAADKKKIKEAVVAIPFVEKSGRKQFYRIPRNEINTAINNRDLGSKSVVKMVDLMRQYVFPPRLDFLTNEQIEPFAMYIFEFELELTKKDLTDIWQNILPEVKTEIQEAVFSHNLVQGEFMGHGSGLESSLRWLVFKVKQKAEWNYFATTADSTDDGRFRFALSDGGRVTKKVSDLPYSYNWPYDFCSIVELVKMDAKIKIKKKTAGTSAIQAAKHKLTKEQRISQDPISGDALEKAISDVVALSEQATEKAASKKKPR